MCMCSFCSRHFLHWINVSPRTQSWRFGAQSCLGSRNAQRCSGRWCLSHHKKHGNKLVGGSTPVGQKVEMHETATKDGVATMRPVLGGLSIPPGRTVTLAPGGYHIMIIGLNAPLKEGDHVPMTLQFE